MPENPLGEQVASPSKYDSGILYPIPRWPARSLLDIDKKILMYGIDHWHAYELSWLNGNGKPQVAIGEFYFNSDSENIVESKSLKLYLNALHQESFKNSEELEGVIGNDLSALSKSEVKVEIYKLGKISTEQNQLHKVKSIDSHDVLVSTYQPDETLLQLEDQVVFDEELNSDLFKCNCPVTGQPDLASFKIQYTGAKIDEKSLLTYLCSYRTHQAYHEECAERIYRDIMQQCRPNELTIALNFLRRGGLDINVYRSTVPINSESVSPRLIRQ